MPYRKTAGLFILVIFAVLLTSCWDKTEMDELALVSMVGVDSDPDSGKKTVYYQIINPLTGSSAKGMPGEQEAPVYTFEISGSSWGEIHTMIYKMLPRRLFVAHTKLLLVSEQAARDGIRDLVNFIEMQPYGRSSVPMLIADGSISSIMNTVTPLEPVPSNSIDNRVDLLLRNSLLVGKPIKVNDVIEWMEKSEMIVLPMIAEVSRSASLGSQPSDDINANLNNFIIRGGAVFRNYRMVGTLSDSELVWYNLLNGGQGRHVQRFQVDDKRVSAGLKLIRLKRNVIWKSGQPVVQFRLDIQLSTALASEHVPHSRDEVKELESGMNEIIAEKSLAFYQMTKSRGWDLLKIRDLLRKHAPNVSDIEQAAKNAEVEIHVNTKLLRTGSLSQPY